MRCAATPIQTACCSIVQAVAFRVFWVSRCTCKLDSKVVSRKLPTAGIDNLPETASRESLEHEDFLQAFHHALLEVRCFKSGGFLHAISGCRIMSGSC